MDELGSPSSPPPPMTIDGADQDLALASSAVLTRHEVISRRLRRVKQLALCYRRQYWALVEDLKSKYRDYYWTYGKSPFKEGENTEDQANRTVSGNNANTINGSEKVMLGSAAIRDDIVRCAFSGCKTKAMALTRFCHSHILSDSKQKLYRGCNAVVKNLPTGPSLCNKPVLRSMVPPACNTHYQLGEKCLARAIRREGYIMPTNHKPYPKVHAVISEYIRHMYIKHKDEMKQLYLESIQNKKQD